MRKILRLIVASFLLLFVYTGDGYANGGNALKEAISTVAVNLKTNMLKIKAKSLRTKANPKGEGTFVYVSKTRFYGVKRNIVWLVIDGQAYPLNGATKNIIPSLPWPREASEDTWNKTGLNPYTATEAIEIVFEKRD